jgi:hypothetical protein
MLHKPSLTTASRPSEGLGRDAGFYILWWIKMRRKCEYSGRVGGLTRESQCTQPIKLRFRAMVGEQSNIDVALA